MRVRESIPAWPAAERPRERLHSCGAVALSNRELLAILIGSGQPGYTALDIAGGLLTGASGSLRQLSGMRAAELSRIDGIGPAVAARLVAALELGRRLAREAAVDRPRIGGPRDIYERCGPALRDLQQEEFHVLLLNTQRAVTSELVVTRGTLDTSVVHPREVFRAAIAESASAVILVHNHPSGDPTPSPEDVEVTHQLAEAGTLLGIPVLDHVVVGAAGYVSLVECGLLHPERT